MRFEFGLEQIGRHCRSEYDHIVESVFLEQALQISLQPGAGKTGHGDGFARDQRACASNGFCRGADEFEMAVSARQLPHRVKMRKITWVIHKTSQMHGAQGSQVLEQGVATGSCPLCSADREGGD